MSIKKALDNRAKDCPRCWVPMVKERLPVFGPDIEVDRCPECGGVWFDPGELSRAVGRRLGGYLTKSVGVKSESQLVCPRCGGLMDLERVADVEVDVCIECGGAWLDAGELERLRDIASQKFKGDILEKVAERYEESRLKR